MTFSGDRAKFGFAEHSFYTAFFEGRPGSDQPAEHEKDYLGYGLSRADPRWTDFSLPEEVEQEAASLICRSIAVDPACAQLILEITELGRTVHNPHAEDEIDAVRSMMCPSPVREEEQEEESPCEELVRKRVTEMVRMNSGLLQPPEPLQCGSGPSVDSRFGSVDFSRSFVHWSLASKEFSSSQTQAHLEAGGNSVRLQATASLDLVIPSGRQGRARARACTHASTNASLQARKHACTHVLKLALTPP